MADFSILKQQIAAALPENTEGEITATIMVAQFWAAIDAINTAKADQGDLDDLALAVAGKADIFGTSVPLALEDNELTLKYDEYQFDLGGDDMTLTLRLSYGLISNSSGVRVYAGRGLAFGDEGVLEVDTAIVEEVANKVTEISADSNDSEYPSAKCVYDAIFGAMDASY